MELTLLDNTADDYKSAYEIVMCDPAVKKGILRTELMPFRLALFRDRE